MKILADFQICISVPLSKYGTLFLSLLLPLNREKGCELILSSKTNKIKMLTYKIGIKYNILKRQGSTLRGFNS